MKKVKVPLFFKSREHKRPCLRLRKSERGRDLPQTLEEKQRKEEQKRLFKKIKNECDNLTIVIKTYIFNHRRSDLTEKYWRMLDNKFSQAKEKIEMHLQMLEEVGVKIPPEFKEIIGRLDKLENFMYMSQYNKLSTQIYNLLEDIRDEIV